MFPDTYIRERRLQVIHELPWVLSASVVMEMTDEDLDALAIANEIGRDAYWRVLCGVMTRIEERQANQRKEH